jgi:murein DD-endopeptidase MepM/ murein hydrolase activator NlpD
MREHKPASSADSGRFISIIAWMAALVLVIVAVYLGWQRQVSRTSVAGSQVALAQPALAQPEPVKVSVPLPTLQSALTNTLAIPRYLTIHTIIPNRPGDKVKDYTVEQGDSVFEIAQKFNIKPETVLWANYDQLNDNPDMISLGMTLKIPPVDGVLYKWQANDTVAGVAAKFDAKAQDILNWPGNDLDLINPDVPVGALVMVPGGHREFRQWIIPTIPRGQAGVSKNLYGPGTCTGGYEGAYGTGSFIWPADNHYLSGNDYWSGHLGIDIAAGEGAPVYAADSGVVVFSGWALVGYGNMVMIDHGNGYQTLYGHMSSIVASCGRSVAKGAVIGYAGATGNATGPHLHFEVRFQGGFVNPWYVLPAP